MKYAVVLTLIGCLTLSGDLYAQAKKPKSAEIKIKTSAQCGQCKMRIEKALVWERAIRSADLEVMTQTVTVKYKPKNPQSNSERRL